MLRDEKLSLSENWEALLERMMLTRSDGIASERVYICSPCRAETPDEVIRNMKAARVYMFYTYIYLQVIPKAPHAYIPILLRDGYENERTIALSFGSQMLEGYDRLFVCGSRLSEGMCAEIIKAAEHSIPVQVFSKQAYGELCIRLEHYGVDSTYPRYEDGHLHFALSWGADELAPYWEESR